MSRLESALPIIGQEFLTPYPHHPTGRCRDCAYWLCLESANPNLAECFLHDEAVNSEWSCWMFWTGELPAQEDEAGHEA